MGGGYSGNDYGSFITGGHGMTGGGMNYGGQMPGQDMFGGYGNGSMFDQSNGPFSVPGQDPSMPPANPFTVPPQQAPQSGYGLRSSGGFMGGQGKAPSAPIGLANWQTGARSQWGAGQGPNYT